MCSILFICFKISEILMSLCNLSNHTSWHSWSPDGKSVAFGTAAQQLDASFSTDSNLTIKSLDFSTGIKLVTSHNVTTKTRFQSLTWTPTDLIVGGHDDGSLSIHNNQGKHLHSIAGAHVGPVRCLDFNKFKPNLQLDKKHKKIKNL